jgi:hypothetical protein
MKKRLMNLMAIVAALGMIFVAGPVLAVDVETHDGTTMSGTVPFCASWQLAEDDVTPFTSAVDIAAYDADCIVVADLIAITNFDCNTKFKITATRGDWTLPGNYIAAGVKNSNDADLLLFVDDITGGYVSEPLAALGNYGTDYTLITTSGSDIIGGGAVGAAAGHGVEGAAANISAKIPMDWATDIVGAYSVTTTLTISEVTS